MPNLGVQVEIHQDNASPAIRRLIGGLTPERINPIIGRSAQQSYKAHLLGVSNTRPNKLGGRRTYFFESAAKGTSWRVVGDHVVISIASVGIRQRYFGGTIKPKTKQYLTIPAIPEAHGKRASEFPDLHFAIVPDTINGKIVMRPALVQGARSLLRTRRVKGVAKVKFAGSQEQRVVFWLVRKVTQQPDPTILPYPEQVEQKALNDVAAYARLLAERGN